MQPFEEFCRKSGSHDSRRMKNTSSTAVNGTGSVKSGVKDGGDDNSDMEKSFILAGLGNIALWTADPEFASEILRRPDEFQQPLVLRKILSTFGDNVFTTGMLCFCSSVSRRGCLCLGDEVRRGMVLSEKWNISCWCVRDASVVM